MNAVLQGETLVTGFRSRAIAMAALAAIALSGEAFAQGAADRTIVPGVRVGAVTKNMPLAQIKRIYGANARVGTIKAAEGDFYGAELFVNKPDYVRVYAENKRTADMIEILAEKSPWRTANGIRVGATLAEIEKANGRPFLIKTYEGEGGGYRLAEALGGKIPNSLILHFFTGGKLTEAETKRLGAEGGIRSNDPLARKAGFSVYRVTVSFR